MRNRALTLAALLFAGLTLAGCFEENVSDKREREQTARITEQLSTQLGMPAVVLGTEKSLVKMLYELRDNPKLATTAYWTDQLGNLHKLCNSLGYGIPYGVQYTNPMRDTYYGSGTNSGSAVHFSLPQPEPNGLFMPSTAEGTWIICLDPTDGASIKPVYVEPRVIVSPFPLGNETIPMSPLRIKN